MGICMARFVAVGEMRSGVVVGSSDDSCRSPEGGQEVHRLLREATKYLRVYWVAEIGDDEVSMVHRELHLGSHHVAGGSEHHIPVAI